ncbi:hypothetical protein GIB67_042217 [Kingdonia uniflora]|uniref:Uncharacterized protein n=1 Tax=Kingdonia uniflora TaxID=39325 RepID=A0A7J7LE57_9MAGN|nr:hypothetical protein GIB67_042217 [Kingdonia uniflora]
MFNGFRNPVTVAEHTKLDDEMPRYQMGKEGSSKKAKLDGTSRGTRSCSGLTIVSKDDNSKDAPEKEAATSDIMSIVRGTNRKSSDGVKKDDGSGLRVKKIMRRTAEDASAKLVENIRKEIREAVRNKSTKDFGKNNLFDPKLLSAFRAATGPRTQQEPIRRLNPSIVKAKNAILQKGKSRENLTKKIYGNAKGRRRRAWNRDCEVEFWKHRCVRASKAEKIETLKSVLNLLRRSSDSSEMEHITDGEAANGILSRVYLADASVFPRKEDIKPFSAFSGLNLKENVSNPIENERPLIHAEITKKDHSNELIFHKKSISSPNGPVKKAQSPKGTMSKSDVNIDKRKWALEVLARKTARLGKDITEDKPEKKAVLKGNFPLLAQLPTDMKPVLGPSCHNKVPISVRQTQLYRLTEYFLKKANLPVIKRTGDTELAVADAVNIEKEVADRSNSKLVYINLCSQVLSQHTHHRDCKKGADSNPSTETTVLNPDQPSSDLSADEALKLAGLVSDEDLSDEDDCLIMPKDEEPDSVFDMDNHPELDIYGDFEYDLGGDDLAIDGSILQVSRSEPEEGDSKLKLVFSTLKSEKPDTGLKSKDHETLEIRRDTLSPPLELLEGEISGEPFLAECEELYGPDKEPLVEKYPIEVSKEPNILNEDRVHEQIDNCRSNEAAKENILSSGGESSSLTKDNGTKKENKTNCKPFDIASSISKKVEAYIKEHIRPLCKSGVITVQQYRWAVDRTTDKVMRYHCKEKNANFLIQEGEKVKKLATQYVEAAQQKECL